ncbi:MAG: hypothetical protein M1814_002146 [Vezdaea aestivalis]|nr:MAG: hypothetical protein M1814_002146 [Vezdaea aestivalis]
MSKTATSRLQKELAKFRSTPSVLHLGPVSDNDLLRWEARISGPCNALHTLSIEVPDSYPLKPPAIKFTSQVVHPNIDFRTGEICLDLLKDAWTPTYQIATTVEAIVQLLHAPAADAPLNVDAARLLRDGDSVAFEALERLFTGTDATR